MTGQAWGGPTGWDPDDRPRFRMDEVLAAAAARLPDQEAVVGSGQRMRFGPLDRLADRIATELAAAGVGAGSRVAISIPTTAVAVGLLYGISRAGAVSVPLNPYWVAEENRDAIQRAGASHLVVVAADNPAAATVLAAGRGLGAPPRLAVGLLGAAGDVEWDTGAPTQAGRRGPDGPEVAMVLFTSGSTARPKGVVLRHDALVGAAHYYRLAFDLNERDRYLLLLPIYHVGGIVDGLLASHLAGATCVTVPRFDPEVMLTALDVERVTITTAFDSLFHKLRAVDGYAAERHPHLKKASGGENPRSYQRLLDMGIQMLLPSYGLTETSSAVSIARRDRPVLDWRGTVGMPVPGLEVRIVDPDTETPCTVGVRGEIRVRGWAVSPGYIDGSDGRDAAGFFRTGDLGSLGPGGELRFEGRLKQMIKSGGENVSEHEVELFLATEFPAVRQAVVVGVPDAEWGEKVVAFVELFGGACVSAEEIRGGCKGKLAGFKVPKHVWVMDGLAWPLLATGKLDKRSLRELAVQRLA